MREIKNEGRRCGGEVGLWLSIRYLSLMIFLLEGIYSRVCVYVYVCSVEGGSEVTQIAGGASGVQQVSPQKGFRATFPTILRCVRYQT